MNDLLELFFGNKKEESHIGLSAVRLTHHENEQEECTKELPVDDEPSLGWLNLARNTY